MASLPASPSTPPSTPKTSRSSGLPNTQLAGHEQMLHGLKDFAEGVRTLLGDTHTWRVGTSTFVASSLDLIVRTPVPPTQRQVGDMQQPPQPLPVTPPADHEHLFDPSLIDRLAEHAPTMMDKTIRDSVEHPLNTWIMAYDSAQDRLPNLQKLRPKYDTMRNKLHHARKLVVEEEARGPVQWFRTAAGPHYLEQFTGAGTVAKKAEQHRANLYQMMNTFEPEMMKFEVEDQNLLEHILWLVSQAARLKGHLVSFLGGMLRLAEAQRHPAHGLLLEFPRHCLARPEETLEAYAATGEGIGPRYRSKVNQLIAESLRLDLAHSHREPSSIPSNDGRHPMGQEIVEEGLQV